MARKGIYKRGDIWWICYAGLDGKVVRKSTGTDKYKEAELMLHSEKKAVQEGKHPETKILQNYTFSELSEKYKAWVNGRQASAENKEYTIDRLIERFGFLPLRKFNTALLEQLQTDLMSKGLRSEKTKGVKPEMIKGLKPASINRIISTVKHMFTKAVDWEMVEADTLKKVRKVNNLREDKRLRFLSVEEAQGLISVCDEHLKPIVITALNTGMRKGEILRLRWSQVDLQHGFILLDKTKNGERREIPVNDTLRTVFRSLRRQIDVPYVFHAAKKLSNYQNVKRSFATALERARITDFHFHDLRHTFASQLVMAGVDLVAVKELLGHKDIKMTLRYAHLAPAHKRKAVNVLDALLNAPTTTHLQPTSQLLHNQIEKELANVS
jgi:integrase